MSATADADLFDDYFKNPSKIAAVAGVSTTQVHIAGFTHPVREYFLEDVFEMTGHAVGKSGPYAKRKQIKKVKSNAQVESLLAEKAAKRKAERVALGLEGEDEDANDGRTTRTRTTRTTNATFRTIGISSMTIARTR